MSDTNIRRSENYKELQELNRDYNKTKSKLIEENENEIAQIKKRHDEKKETLSHQNEAVINHIRNAYAAMRDEELDTQEKSISQTRQKMENDKLNYQRAAIHQKENQSKILNDLKNEASITIEQERQKSSSTYEALQNRYQKNLNEMKERHNNQLSTIEKNNFNQIQQAQTEGLGRLSEIKTDFEIKQQELNQTGASQLEYDKTKFQNKLTALNQEFEKQKTQERQFHDAQMKEATELHLNTREKTKEGYQAQIQDLNKKYQKDIQINNEATKKSLDAQQRLHDRELLKQKLGQLSDLKRFSDKKEDPFYKLENRETQFNENSNEYLLTTFIPAHDKENITVRVQADKVTVSGDRRFKDKINDENYSASTANYQTFREEFKFTTPVVEKAAIQSRDGDYVTVRIPKMNRISKKV